MPMPPGTFTTAGSGRGGNGGLSADDLLDRCVGDNAPQSLVGLFTVHA
jgi:hypothetical protein